MLADVIGKKEAPLGFKNVGKTLVTGWCLVSEVDASQFRNSVDRFVGISNDSVHDYCSLSAPFMMVQLVWVCRFATHLLLQEKLPFPVNQEEWCP